MPGIAHISHQLPLLGASDTKTNAYQDIARQADLSEDVSEITGDGFELRGPLIPLIAAQFYFK